MTDVMMEPLHPVAVRILGSLIEKESTTPDNYPLTLNALVAACNQSSNRDPVMNIDERTALEHFEELSRRSLARALHRSDSRVLRYRHAVVETLHLHTPELAALSVLLLRGPQTAGEIRTRAGRIYEFPDMAQTELALRSLMTLSVPLVTLLPRRPGQKEARYAHLLSGEPILSNESADGEVARESRVDRVSLLEDEVAALRRELSELRSEFDALSRELH